MGYNEKFTHPHQPLIFSTIQCSIILFFVPPIHSLNTFPFTPCLPCPPLIIFIFSSCNIQSLIFITYPRRPTFPLPHIIIIIFNFRT